MEEAIFADCHLLISNFVDSGQPTFESFCTEWKNLSFQHIYAPQTTSIEIQQTTAAAFHVGKRLMCQRPVTSEMIDYLNNSADEDDANDERRKLLLRIGALYLLYALYFKQPLELYTKIEVSLETWRKMKEFIKIELPPGGDYDEAKFVFWKLYQSEAFRFRALDYCVGLENLVDYDNLDRSVSNMTLKGEAGGGGDRLYGGGIGKQIERLSSFAEIKQTAPALVELEDGYNKIKSTLIQKDNLDSQLLPSTSIFQSIRDGFERIERIFQQSTEDNSHQEDVVQKNSKRREISIKRSLKDKAFEVTKKENITSSTKESSSNDANVEKKIKPTIPKRMSSRTIFKQKLPKEIEDDLKPEGDDDDDGEIDSESDFDDGEDLEEFEITYDDDNDDDMDDDDDDEDESATGNLNVTKTCEELLKDL